MNIFIGMADWDIPQIWNWIGENFIILFFTLVGSLILAGITYKYAAKLEKEKQAMRLKEAMELMKYRLEFEKETEKVQEEEMTKLREQKEREKRRALLLAGVDDVEGELAKFRQIQRLRTGRSRLASPPFQSKRRTPFYFASIASICVFIIFITIAFLLIMLIVRVLING